MPINLGMPTPYGFITYMYFAIVSHITMLAQQQEHCEASWQMSLITLQADVSFPWVIIF